MTFATETVVNFNIETSKPKAVGISGNAGTAGGGGGGGGTWRCSRPSTGVCWLVLPNVKAAKSSVGTVLRRCMVGEWYQVEKFEGLCHYCTFPENLFN